MTPEENGAGQTRADPNKAKGGLARAEALTPEQRQDIARKAAQVRWDANVPQAGYEGSFDLAGQTIYAAVLQNGKRLLSQGTFLQAIGRSRTPKAGAGIMTTVDGTPFFLQAEALRPFISNELLVSTTPVFFKTKSGQKAVGYDAELLPMVAEVYLKMRDAHLEAGRPIPRQYQHIIRACDAITRGLARVGIAALVDEATGYQDERDHRALQAILDKFLRKEFAAWAKRFPDEFYQQIFRLRGWTWQGMRVNRPQVVASYTKNIVWARLTVGILKELEARNPIIETGRRKAKHHQFLTDDIGHPALAQHLYAVIGLMRISDSWPQFMRLLDRAYPRKGDTLTFDFYADAP